MTVAWRTLTQDPGCHYPEWNAAFVISVSFAFPAAWQWEIQVSLLRTFSCRLSVSSLCVASLSSCARRWAVSFFRYSISLKCTNTHTYWSGVFFFLLLLSFYFVPSSCLLLLVFFNQPLGFAVFPLQGLILRLSFLQVFIHSLKRQILTVSKR